MDCQDSKLVGCLECNSTDIAKCGKCADHFVLKDGKCECDSQNGYTLDDDICKSQEQMSCFTKHPNCYLCSNAETCSECDLGYTLSEGACNPTDCSSIPNCTTCANKDGQLICTLCQGDFHVSYEGKCVIPTEMACTTEVTGCINCSNINPTFCVTCDATKFYTARGGRCVCIDGYDLVDGVCMEPIKPVAPPTPPPSVEISDDLFADGVTSTSQNITFKDDNTYDNTKVYTMTIQQETDLVVVPQKLEKVEFAISERAESDPPLVIKTEKTTDVTLTVSNTAKVAVPTESQNIDITGKGEVQLSSANAGATPPEKIELGKLIPSADPESEEATGITLKSDVKEIIVEEVQIFGKTFLNGLEDGTTICKNLNIEGGADFVPKHVSLETVKIGLLSVLDLSQPNTITENTEFQVYYNRTVDEDQYPIRVKRPSGGSFPDFSKARRIIINTIAAGLQLTEIGDTFTLAHFEDEANNMTANYLACEELRGKYRQTDSDFGNENCFNGTNYVNLRAEKVEHKKDDDDKGLSGGAIAGIVIACVVVVAAIIALLVYFLVIKKRNQSTTSTQGDSSIAI